MVQLNLELVFKLTILLEEVFFINGISEVLVVFGQQVHLAVMNPVVVFVSHGVLSPNAAVLSTTEQEQLMNFLVQVFPVQDVRKPCNTVCRVEE
jgi:hypothetical protein